MAPNVFQNSNNVNANQAMLVADVSKPADYDLTTRGVNTVPKPATVVLMLNAINSWDYANVEIKTGMWTLL